MSIFSSIAFPRTSHESFPPKTITRQFLLSTKYVICVYAYIRPYVNISVRAYFWFICMYKTIYINVSVRACFNVFIYIHTYIHYIYIYICIHTHTQTHRSDSMISVAECQAIGRGHVAVTAWGDTIFASSGPVCMYIYVCVCIFCIYSSRPCSCDGLGGHYICIFGPCMCVCVYVCMYILHLFVEAM
jgi:hypothetical protein